jgi:hypothetical protein
MEFKAGDRVRVRGWEDMEKQFGVDNDGDIKANCYFTKDMRPLCGKKFKIKKVLDGGIVMGLNTSYNISTDMLEIAGHDARMQINVGDVVIAGKNNTGASDCEGKEGVVTGIWFSGDEFPYLVDFGKGKKLWCAASKKGADKRVIIEYGKGKPTVATLLVGGNVVKTATAKCDPDDEYDEQVGVNLAVERLFEKPKKVFSLEQWLSYINPESEISRRIHEKALMFGWPQKCEGKTLEECKKMGYSCLSKDWFVEK